MVRLNSFSTCSGPRGRGDVVILRLASQQKIAHAAAHPERAETGGLEMADDFNGSGTQRLVSHLCLRFTIYAAFGKAEGFAPVSIFTNLAHGLAEIR
jgi:hypothetical protein